jgi:hypothetical protein
VTELHESGSISELRFGHIGSLPVLLLGGQELLYFAFKRMPSENIRLSAIGGAVWPVLSKAVYDCVN